MNLSPKEAKLIRAIREAGTDISFLLVHLANLYDKQGQLDRRDKRANAEEMQRRSKLYMAAYHEILGVKSGRGRLIYLAKEDR